MPIRVFVALLVCSGLAQAAPLSRAHKDFAAQFSSASKDERTALLRKNGVKQTALDLKRGYLKTLNTRYKVLLPLARRHGRVESQQDTGRCWLFATTLVLESGMMRRGIDRTNLSESFANYHAWRTRSVALLSRIADGKGDVAVNLAHGFSEGGWFHWAGQLIEAHGMVPSEVMPDTYDGANTGLLEGRLKDLLAEAQEHLRGAQPGERESIMAVTQQRIDRVLETMLGRPPEQFSYKGKQYTPKQYADEVLGFRPQEFVLLSNLPSQKTKTDQGYIWRGELGLKSTKVYNVSSRTLHNAVKRSLDLGEAVWFTAQMDADNPHIVGDYDKVPKQAKNILHEGAFQYGPLLGDTMATRRARIDANTGWGAHAMAFVGYDYEDARPASMTKLQVFNSWGLRQHMYADFFRDYVDVIAVPKAALTPRMLRQLSLSKEQLMPLPIPK